MNIRITELMTQLTALERERAASRIRENSKLRARIIGIFCN